ncbi:hypothetical protein K490DRAFT_59317 [Saccharata proteae CBS 121410]|uniref:Capsule polysaccharide biosynthesis protein n=1 Tax=Saccharata proteae CBS 121410 TaxID=1314787 RepID=A0A9P4LUY9_9PEZI|nr:hypothetical protein K490DRAFT_59317 [Saccharata proteae CBS 121410]
MSALRKLPSISAVLATGAFVTAMASSATVRAFVGRLLGYLGLSAPGGLWRALAVLLLLGNWKNLPGVWHLRLFRGLLYQLYLQPSPFPPSSLFQPIITSTRSPILECDYNLHKSNSTYFADLDISRTHLVTALLRSGIRRLHDKEHRGSESDRAPGTEKVHGSFGIALGGVTCQFKKEIKPYQAYEVWTRLLCWDRKWLYLVSHLVKKGATRPAGYGLQPWRKGKKKQMLTEEEKEGLKGKVFASSIAKYVVKKGRWTVPPEQVLMNCGLLPAKPKDATRAGDDGEADKVGEANGDTPEEQLDAVDAAVLPGQEAEEWTWDMVQKEIQRGMKFAEMFAGLDGLHDEFDGGAEGVLGEFPDLLW